MSVAVSDAGDRALRLEIPAGVDRPALVRALRALPGVTDASATETHALVVFDGEPPDVDPAIRAAVAADSTVGRRHELDVVLDGEDRAEVAGMAGLGSDEELAHVLEASELVVSFLGFCPGFAYLRGLDPRLASIERRSTPRPRVPAGSLAVAGGFVGIYPFATPGGWNLLGRALGSVFEGDRARFLPGDRVRLRVVSERGPAQQIVPTETTPRAVRAFSDPALSASSSGASTAPARAGLVVVSSAPAFVQDLGRPGRLAEAIPGGGALVAHALVRANRLAGATDDAPAIERFGPLLVEAQHEVRLATDDGIVVDLRAGQRASLEWGPGRRVGYVAVTGGFDVPRVHGGHGTHVAVGLGGHEGRALRRGDVLSIGERHAQAPSTHTPAEHAARAVPLAHTIEARGDRAPAATPIDVRVVPGPDTTLSVVDALERLLSTEWRVSHASDRTGIRLEGAAIPCRPGLALRTVPMIAGCIELPPSGLPIVLGPDHPTTGGYPVLAVVTSSDLPTLCGAPVGSRIRFIAISAADARARRATLGGDD